MPEIRFDGSGSRIETKLERALVAWVRAVQRRYRAVLVATGLVSIGLLAYVASCLGLNTSHTALLSDDLPFWSDYNSFAEVFPIVDEAIFVVIDGETPARAREATMLLSERLAEDAETFPQVYVPGGGEFFERHALLYLDVDELYDLSDHLAAVQPILAELARDRTLPGLAAILDEAFVVAETTPDVAENLTAIFDSVSHAAQAVLEGHPRPISWTELLLERTLPGDSARRLIVLNPRLRYDRFLPASEPMRKIRSAARALDLDPEHGVRVRLTGNIALNHEELIGVAEGAAMAVLGSFALVAVILFVALGSARLVACILLTLLVGLIWTAGFATAAVGQLNVVSIAFAVLFIGLGVDFGIHFGMRYAELVRSGVGRNAAMEKTSRGVGGSLVLCAVTTAIGFYAFLPTDYKAVAELGLISGTGMAISLFASLTVLPALLSLGDPARAAGGRPPPRGFTVALIPLAARHALWVRGVAALLGVGALCLVPHLAFDVNVARIRDPSKETTQTFEELLADSDNSPWTIDLLAEDLVSAEALAEKLRELDVVERAVTLVDYVPEDQEEKLEILADLAFFVPAPATFSTPQPDPPVTHQILALRALMDLLDARWIAEGDPDRRASARRAKAQLARFLSRLETLGDRENALESFQKSLLGSLQDQMLMLWDALEPGKIEIGSLPPGLTERMLAGDGRARVELLPREDLNDNEALARFVDGVRALAPQATGSAVSVLEWSRATVRSVREALLWAVTAIALVVFLLWKRPVDVLLVVAPFLLAALLTGATAVLIGLPMNFVNVVVLPLLLGIGVDSGIHLVHRHRVAQQEDPKSWAGDDLLSTSTAQAVFFSALTTMASFGSLALAAHRGLASLGALLLIGVIYMLLCNLVLLPALISKKFE